MESILLVEDKFELREMLTKALQRMQYAVLSTGTAEEAMAALRKQHFSAVLTDLKLPSATGKELFARAIHQISPRATKPYIALNCAALPESLIENELFGHERGAFTGADTRRAGKFELANGGTVFLDEIGELPLAVQGKLLRVIEDKMVQRLGSSADLKVDIRLIAATNRDLEQAVEANEFRSDLYYRLAVIPLRISSLRARGDDVLVLADYFLDRFQREW